MVNSLFTVVLGTITAGVISKVDQVSGDALISRL
jgi:hypothetical protein